MLSKWHEITKVPLIANICRKKNLRSLSHTSIPKLRIEISQFFSSTFPIRKLNEDTLHHLPWHICCFGPYMIHADLGCWGFYGVRERIVYGWCCKGNRCPSTSCWRSASLRRRSLETVQAGSSNWRWLWTAKHIQEFRFINISISLVLFQNILCTI